MDPLAHTLFGAALAEAGLKKKTALATGTLIIGANLPDIDAIFMLWGSDTALYFRRGWTHGVLALMIWPFILTGAMLLYDRIRRNWRPGLRSTRSAKGPPLKPEWLLVIAYIGVWSHPLLDWLNVYGVRLLMPFSDSWFYGDTLFIVDPWMWLLTGTGVVFARSQSWPGIIGWIMLGGATTAIVTGVAVVPVLVKTVWVVVILGIAFFRWLGWYRGNERYIAAGCLLLLAGYSIVMFSGSRMTVDYAERHLSAQGINVEDVMAEPKPARMFTRGGVAASNSQYYLFQVNWLDPESFRIVTISPRTMEPNLIVQAAMEAQEVRGLMNWIRFPHYELHRIEDGWQVTIRDLRFVDPRHDDPSGIGMAIVELDSHLNPR